jgi:thiamine-monophosphate kinase
MALRGLASAMIDVSDGLAADLGHVLSASGVGAEVRLSELPLSPQVAARVVETGDWSLPVTSGDDYELCFTLPAAHLGELGPLAARTGCPLRAIGRVTEGPGLTFLLPGGARWSPAQGGYDHFADDGPNHDRDR